MWAQIFLLVTLAYVIKHTDTTDVQQVQAKQKNNDVEVQCNFIYDSDARGCMVVLVGDSVNTTVNLTRCGTNSCSALTLHSQSLSCYFEVFAFDIESDGSVGALAISGVLVDKPSSKMAVISCAQHFPSGECLYSISCEWLIAYYTSLLGAFGFASEFYVITVGLLFTVAILDVQRIFK